MLLYFQRVMRAHEHFDRHFAADHDRRARRVVIALSCSMSYQVEATGSRRRGRLPAVEERLLQSSAVKTLSSGQLALSGE